MSEKWSDSDFAYTSEYVQRVLYATGAADNLMDELLSLAIYGALAVKLQLFDREEKRIITAIGNPAYVVECSPWSSSPDEKIVTATAHQCGAWLMRVLYANMFPEEPGFTNLTPETVYGPQKIPDTFAIQVVRWIESHKDQLFERVKVLSADINYGEVCAVAAKMRHEREAILSEGFVPDEPDYLEEMGGEKGGYLGLIVDRDARTIRRVGEFYNHVTVELGRMELPWMAFLILFDAEGRAPDESEWDRRYSGEKSGRRDIIFRLRGELPPLDVMISTSPYRLVEVTSAAE